jgi:hypothetical protein
MDERSKLLLDEGLCVDKLSNWPNLVCHLKTWEGVDECIALSIDMKLPSSSNAGA